VVGGGDAPAGSVGRPIGGVEVQISGLGGAPSADAREGEVLVRGPVVFAGYVGDPTASSAAKGGDGWLHTGDLGRFDHGVLSITGRTEDEFATTSGARVAPRPIEARLEASPDIRYAVVVGEGRPNVGAILAIDPDEVGDWAATKNVPFTTLSTLVGRTEVHDLLKISVDEANKDVEGADQVRCFALLPERLTVDDGVLTPSFKVRRRAAIERYSALIDEMYGSEQEGDAS